MLVHTTVFLAIFAFVVVVVVVYSIRMGTECIIRLCRSGIFLEVERETIFCAVSND
jgi:hypothetical protein